MNNQASSQASNHFTGPNFDFDLNQSPIIYSILNLTPDSFYDGGVNSSIDKVLNRIEVERSYGASVFELGGKSSKPHFDDISAEAEWARIAPYLNAIQKRFPDIVLALDSNTNEVIERALKSGIQIINDIDGFNSQTKLELVAKYKPAVVSMFNGRNFNEKPETLNQIMADFFTHTISDLTASGLQKTNIVLDPGVGFSNHNTLALDIIKMQFTKQMTRYQTPIMIAISRKSFSKQLFNLESADDRLIPTLLFESLMTVLGGRVIRVHDVKETEWLIKTFNLLKTQLVN
ncbi:dihydropteroate synthase [Lentilactobacillus fungorum]|uniref:Dihydropteroate synthase n=1 Tax=Lentilactobacillus fungorum TaxID=2201250 RepID=A0ABQ3VV95_9LACO|nr:dihydropteroate synthase [Lentilactobacillus fungorum]GHP12813.1 dihydropteroate synthase [Lentilactobacillus fungorum]